MTANHRHTKRKASPEEEEATARPQRKKEEYEDILALKADLTLMTSNAKKYNEKGSSIYEDATTIQVPPHSTFLSHLFLPSLTVSELSINTRMKSNSH